MRRLVVCGLLLLLGLVQSAFGTDYELTIDSGDKRLLQEQALTVYEPFGLVKPGDRIVSIVAGKLPTPNMACRVWVGTGEGSSVLDAKGVLRSFHGEIRLGKGAAPKTSVEGALLMHVPPPTVVPKVGVVKVAGSYLFSHPLIWIILSIVILVPIGIALYKLNAPPPPGVIPTWGKKAYEGNLQEVKAKLERIMEAQENLVKRPPVLRTFRKQIDRFDRRLDKLEESSASAQDALSRLAATAAEVEQSLNSIASLEQRAQKHLQEIDAKLAHQTEQDRAASAILKDQLNLQAIRVEELNTTLGAQLGSQGARAEEINKALGGQLSAQDARVQELSKALSAQLGVQSARIEEISKALGSQLGAQGVRVDELNKALSAQLSSQSARTEEITKTFGSQLGFQAANTEKLSKALGDQLAAQASRTEELNKGVKEQLGSQAAQTEELAKSLGGKLEAQASRTEELNGAVAEQLQSQAARLDEMGKAVSAQLDLLQGKLAETEQHLGKAQLERSKEIGENLSQLQLRVDQIESVATSLGELDAKVSTMLGEVSQLEAKVSANSAGLSEFQKASALAYSGSEGKIAELKSVLSTMQGELSRVHPELEALKSSGEIAFESLDGLSKLIQGGQEEAPTKAQVDDLKIVTAASLGELSKLVKSGQAEVATKAHVDELKAVHAGSLDELSKLVKTGQQEAVTKAQIDQLKSMPESIAALAKNIEGLEARLAQSGLSKADLSKILGAHEKLGALSNEVSQALQRILEQKLTSVLTQSLAAKKGKEGEESGISDKGAAALTQVAQHLISEMEQRKGLENMLVSVKSMLDPIPDALQRMEDKLAEVPTPVEAQPAPAFDTKQLESLIESVGSRLDMVPEALHKLEQKIANAPAGGESQPVQRLDTERLEALLADVSSRLELVPTALQNLEERVAHSPGSGDRQALPVMETKHLEGLLEGVSSKLELLPEALQQLESRISESAGLPVAEGSANLDTAQLESVLQDLAAKLNLVPDALQRIEDRMSVSSYEVGSGVPSEGFKSIEALLEQTRNVVEAVPQRLDNIDKSLEHVTSQFDATNGKLDEAAHLVGDLRSATNEVVQAASQLRETSARDTESVRAVQSAPIKTASAPQLVKPEPAVETPAASVAAQKSEVEKLVELVIEEPVVVQEKPAARKDKSPIERVASSLSLREEWLCSGGDSDGMWSTRCDGDLVIIADPERAMRPLTPTETPGIEYEVGAMLFAQDKVIYGHGDSVRGFWPGGNERSILLSSALPGDPWRLALLENKLFCVLEKRVDILDLSMWARGSGFAGEFINQCLAGSMWAGIRNGSVPVLEYRDLSGELSSKPVDLPKDYREALPMLSDGEHVYLARPSGEILRATRAGVSKFCHVNTEKNGKLVHLALLTNGLVALVEDPAGVSIYLIDSDGDLQQSAKTSSAQISGNVVVSGGRLYFFDPDASELVTYDLATLTPLAGVKLPSVKLVRRMAGLTAGNLDVLLVAGSDAGGKLGSVFLLEPATEEKVLLCSTNQPHVDAIFAASRAVVATSSSYQNIIRVFDPFENANGAVGQAA